MEHFEFPVWDAICADSFTEVTTFASAGESDVWNVTLCQFSTAIQDVFAQEWL